MEQVNDAFSKLTLGSSDGQVLEDDEAQRDNDGSEEDDNDEESSDQGDSESDAESDNDECTEIDDVFKEQCKKVMRGLLLEIFPEAHVDDNLEYFLTGVGAETYYRQPDNVSPEAQEKADQVNSAAYRLFEFYKKTFAEFGKLFPTCYLLLNAPMESTSRYLEEDEQANRVQFCNFYNELHKTEHGKQRNPRAEVVVHTKKAICDAIRKLFDEMAMKTKKITIVFNGEGFGGNCVHPPGSLCLHNDDPMPMNDFISEILSIWKDIVMCKAAEFSTNCPSTPTPGTQTELTFETGNDAVQTASDLKLPPGFKEEFDVLPPVPASVSVVFGQCYSHNYSDKLNISTMNSCLDVFPLTDPKINKGQAECTVQFHTQFRIKGVIRHVVNSIHDELDYFARTNAPNSEQEPCMFDCQQ